MQIHFFEHYRLEGLARQHALHNLKLHIMVLDHLRKTYWAADMQHKLFSEALKAMENPKPASDKPHSKDDLQARQIVTSRRNSNEQQTHTNFAQHPFELNAETSAESALVADGTVLDDFFVSFNPFNISAFDRTYFATPSDWMLGTGDV